ncbi:MAG: prenyltransferase [Burkholderiales bacterium]
MAGRRSLALALATTRPPFLLLAPACILLGIGTAIWTGGHVTAQDVILVLLGGIAAHAAVNAFNEYFDFRSGLDLHTERTPFSGGSGTLPSHPDLAPVTFLIACATLGVACLVGLYFLVERGPALLPIGLLGVAVVLAYTPWVTRHPTASLIAPGLGFGPLMVVGTHVALTGEYAPAAWIASIVPFFLANNLLLLNQFPDVEADRRVGRRHLPMMLGRPRAAWVYAGILQLAYLTLLVALALHALPLGCALGLLTAPVAIAAAFRVVRHADDLPALMPAMGMNVIVNLATPVLMGIGLLTRWGSV